MGMPREMVSDVGYALMVAFVLARPAKSVGPAVVLEAMLELYERRYRDGRSGRGLVENGRGGTGGHLARVAEKFGLAESTLRVTDRDFRDVSLVALKAAGLDARAMVREMPPPAGEAPAPSPAGGGRGRT